MTEPANPNVLTTQQVCSEYGISSGMLTRLRNSGKIRGQRFGRTYKYLRRVIDAYLAGESDTSAVVASQQWVRPLPVVPRTMR